MEVTKDKDGKEVSVGSKVKVIAVDAGLLRSLPESEAKLLQSMLHEVLEVYEVDEYGQAHVEKGWQLGPDNYESHSLALSASTWNL